MEVCCLPAAVGAAELLMKAVDNDKVFVLSVSRSSMPVTTRHASSSFTSPTPLATTADGRLPLLEPTTPPLRAY